MKGAMLQMDNRVYFNVSSVTNAMRGKAWLEKNGIQGYIGRTMDEQGNNGCGYSIMIMGAGERAEQLLRAAGIRILSVHGGEHTP